MKEIDGELAIEEENYQVELTRQEKMKRTIEVCV